MTELLNARWAVWLANGLAVVALSLAIVFCVQSAQNRGLQDQANAARVQLARAQTLANLDRGLTQLLARTAADTNDVALQALLVRNGVDFKIEPRPAAAAASTSDRRPRK